MDTFARMPIRQIGKSVENTKSNSNACKLIPSRVV